jgi:hypothetical protein
VGLGPLAHVGLIGTFHPSTSFLALSRDRGRHTGRGPGRRDRGIPSHRRRERPPAPAGTGRRGRVGAVYRSGHSRRMHRCRACPPGPRRLPTSAAAPQSQSRPSPGVGRAVRRRHRMVVHNCGHLCGPIKISRGGGPRERH